MERLTYKEEMKLMHPLSNKASLRKFNNNILPFFFYTNYYNNKIIKRINEGGTEDESYLDKLLSLNNQLRAWYRVESCPKADLAFQKYLSFIEQSRYYISQVEEEMKIEPEHLLTNLLEYNNFLSGNITINKNTYKLFKFLLSKEFLTKTEIERITSIRTPSDGSMLVCITRNPIDYLFASTNQSFSSCISLDSGYKIYMGLGGLSLDPNRFMIFITSQRDNIRVHNVKRNKLTHFKYLNRAWGLIGKNHIEKDAIVVLEGYPSDSLIYKKVMEYVQEQTNMVGYDVNDIGGFKSRFEFNLPVHKNNIKSMIYLDDIGIKKIKGKYIYTTKGGYTGNIFFQDFGDFHLLFEELKEMEDLYKEKVICVSCGKRHRIDENMRTGYRQYMCYNCFDKYTIKCDKCKTRGLPKSMFPTADMYVLKFRYYIYFGGKMGKKLCNDCLTYFIRCANCKKLTYNNSRFCYRCCNKKCSKLIIKVGDKVRILNKSIGKHQGDRRWIEQRFYNRTVTVDGIRGDGLGRDTYNCIIVDSCWFTPEDLEVIKPEEEITNISLEVDGGNIAALHTGYYINIP